jgi:hypothetical protein
MTKISLTLIVLLQSQILFAGEISERYSAANQITFTKSGITKDFVGSGFIITFINKTYAVTAKHVLLETMDQGINTVYLQDHVKKWQLAPFNEHTGTVQLGKLLNADEQELLGMKVLQDDWLLFEVSSNDSALKPLKIAESPLKPNEKIKVFGCNYSNQHTCHQGYYTGSYVREEGGNLLIKLSLEDLSQLRGLSGAPVLNQHQEVVGIVSNVVPDTENGGMYFAPFKIQAVADYLESL